MADSQTHALDFLRDSQEELLSRWLEFQDQTEAGLSDLLSNEQRGEHSRRFLAALRGCKLTEDGQNFVDDDGLAECKTMLRELSGKRALMGSSPSETALFVLSLKQPIFERIQDSLPDQPQRVLADVWKINRLLDDLALYTTDAHLQTREELIRRQQEDLLELSTPIIQVWEGIVAVPLVGTLDSHRAQGVTEALLTAIVQEDAKVAILDITGVPSVDSLVAQHLLKTVAAAQLMGATCLISGIRPQIALTMVHLGIEFENITTSASLKAALRRAFTLCQIEMNSEVPA